MTDSPNPAFSVAPTRWIFGRTMRVPLNGMKVLCNCTLDVVVWGEDFDPAKYQLHYHVGADGVGLKLDPMPDRAEFISVGIFVAKPGARECKTQFETKPVPLSEIAAGPPETGHLLNSTMMTR